MKTHPVILAAAALLISGGLASGQQPQGSSGSPALAPSQNASPTTVAPSTDGNGTTAGANNAMTLGGSDTSSASDGSVGAKTPATGIGDEKNTDGATSTLVPVTPNGMTPD